MIPEPGQILDGRFVVEELVGTGGQGMVFRTRNLEWNRDFALKLPLAKALRSEHSKNLFLKEAQTWIRLGVHPNIVRCWFVRPVAGLPALFLDFLGGGSLESKLQSGELQPGQWDTILLVLLQVAEGLTHAHSMGMVHRDLKPENLMVHSDGRVCITDFGLAKNLSDSYSPEDALESLPENSSITAGAVGTPRYGAPEQWVEPTAVRPTTDLYSLGVIMFELLCGQRPFDPPGRTSKPIFIIERHINEAPPDPLAIRQDIPKEMAELCLRLLAKNPADRPQTSLEVLEQLSQLLTSRGGSYRRPAPVPAGDRADLLNNAAASLYSLGKAEQARELLQKGLTLESGHPQCLYNLLQLDLREGKMTREEALRKLDQAMVPFGKALLFIAETEGASAAEILCQIPEPEKSGLVHRLEGDALMYARDFPSAVESYKRALLEMPNDLPSQFRLDLAKSGQSRAEGRIYFPSREPCFKDRSHREAVQLMLAPDGESILAMDESEILRLCIHKNQVLNRVKREVFASQIEFCRVQGHIILVQDREAFEFWNLADLKPLARFKGRVLASDQELVRVLTRTKEGFQLFDLAHQKASLLQLDPNLRPSSKLPVAFSHDDRIMALATTSGRLAYLDAKFELTAFPWPRKLEGLEALTQLALGKERVVFAYRNSLLRCVCLQRKELIWELELGFLPHSVEFDSSGELVLASSREQHFISDSNGNALLRGPGPATLNSRKTMCLVWANSRLQLYRLQPFQRLRTWSECARPVSLQFSSNERRALSVEENGDYRVWEVDEASRVFERNLLMTPGQSYSELIATYSSFREAFDSALEKASSNEFSQALQSLEAARSVAGFHQSEEALHLHWDLSSMLQRDRLEAVWERHYVSKVSSAQFCDDCRHLLLCELNSVELFELSGPRTVSKLRIELPFRPVAAHLAQADNQLQRLVILGLDGELFHYHLRTGESLEKQRLRTGQIERVQLGQNLALIQGKSGQAFSLDLNTGSLSEPIPLLEHSLKRAFLLQDKKALLVAHNGLLMTCLKKARTNAGLPAKPDAMQQGLSYCGDLEESKLRVLGFENGSLTIVDRTNGRPLFALSSDTGPVVASSLNLRTALALCAGGPHLTFYDLSDGKVLKKFVAHTDGIKDLQLTKNGRYLSTISEKGEFRLWEISWVLSHQPGSPHIDWLPSSPLGKIGKFFGRKT